MMKLIKNKNEKVERVEEYLSYNGAEVLREIIE